MSGTSGGGDGFVEPAMTGQRRSAAIPDGYATPRVERVSPGHAKRSTALLCSALLCSAQLRSSGLPGSHRGRGPRRCAPCWSPRAQQLQDRAAAALKSARETRRRVRRQRWSLRTRCFFNLVAAVGRVDAQFEFEFLISPVAEIAALGPDWIQPELLLPTPGRLRQVQSWLRAPPSPSPP